MLAGGSAIGSPKVMKEMLELAATQNIKPWIIKRPMDDVNNVVLDMHASKARCVFHFQSFGWRLGLTCFVGLR